MSYRAILLSVLALVLVSVGCEALRTSRPIMPVREYEKMIVGRFDANYIGTDNCLRACHHHDDKVKRDFEASTMGAQMSSKSGLPIVDCESCHGPGSLAVEGLTIEKVEDDRKQGKQTECDYKTFIDLKELPSPAMSLICLKCHTANATFNLHQWNASEHAVSDVSCSDCHRIHAGPDLIVRPRETFDMCYKCHEKIRAEFALPSHHPVPEKEVTCTDCHNSHGGVAEGLLRKNDIKATCTQCHAEKEGPFVFEHADTMEDCMACHESHGTVNDNLLKQGEPFLCLQCHEGHFVRAMGGPSTIESKSAFYTRCTDCHSTIHGTDIPSATGKGRFTQ
ncbi:MAG: DmsE family decaheme c-type cytochrome [Thermodesulfovibrionales bacterium]|nr:DmsE family decaheme c-type cytochrome [Thermodesulfovibrionales bacterium]